MIRLKPALLKIRKGPRGAVRPGSRSTAGGGYQSRKLFNQGRI